MFEKDIFRLEKGGPLNCQNFTIIQICDIQTATGSVCPVHIQNCDEISYIASGFCRHKVNNVEFDMGPGDLLLLKEGDVHSYTTNAEQPARIFNIGIRIEAQEETSFMDVWNELNGYPIPLLLREANQTEKIFVHIFEEIVGNKYCWEYAVQLYTEQMLLTICRGLQKIHVSAYEPQSTEEAQKRLLYSIINYLDAHIEEVTALKEMCEILHYSYTYISHFFKKMMGISISEYYKNKRFGYAAELLLSDDYSVTDISRRMGYQTVHAFSKAFSNYYGMCPTQYLKTKQANGEDYIL